jgi:serine/threonine-protein kinase
MPRANESDNLHGFDFCRGGTLRGSSGDGGPAAAAILRWPSPLIFDTAGNLYEVDSGSASIREITPDGLIGTVAGTGITGFSGDGGPANQAHA